MYIAIYKYIMHLLRPNLCIKTSPKSTCNMQWKTWWYPK